GLGLGLVEGWDELAQGRIVQLAEVGAGLLRREQQVHTHLILDRELADGARDVGWMRLGQEVGGALVPARVEQLPDRLDDARRLFHLSSGAPGGSASRSPAGARPPRARRPGPASRAGASRPSPS